MPTGLAAGLPVAVSFWGTAGSEPTLVEIAHGYEAARDRDTGPLPAADVRRRSSSARCISVQPHSLAGR